jgi:FixJ family two-component response regulator
MNPSTHTWRRLQAAALPAAPIVYVVDDDVSVRESLELLIRSAGWQPDISGSAEEFLARARVFTPGCLLLDVNLPDINGLDLQQAIADRSELPIIFITGHADVQMAVSAVKAGAAEFLTKPIVVDVVLSAVRRALTRSDTALRHRARLTLLQDRYSSLSHREQQVVTLVVSGRLNKQIAGDMGITEGTVKVHRSNIMRKMKADSLAELMIMACELAITPDLQDARNGSVDRSRRLS